MGKENLLPLYEEKTYENILNDLLKGVPDNINKEEGSIIFNAIAPVAWELSESYLQLAYLYDITFADTAPRKELIARAKERGIEPHEAKCARLEARFNVEVPIESRFSKNDLNYMVVEKKEDMVYQLICETAGIIGNKQFGEISPITFIEDFETGEITKLLIPGEDEEETEHFRERYLNSFKAQAFGGNRADYEQKLEKIQGIGGKKILRRKRGEKSIKIVIIDSTYSIPSDTLIAEVQKIIDPNQDQEGDGLAPIGQIVSILPAVEVTIDITTQIIYQNGYTYKDLQEKIVNIIDNYFLELKKTWEKTAQLVIRISQIESRLLELDGILDIKATRLNEQEENLILQEIELPKRGDFHAN